MNFCSQLKQTLYFAICERKMSTESQNQFTLLIPHADKLVSLGIISLTKHRLLLIFKKTLK